MMDIATLSFLAITSTGSFKNFKHKSIYREPKCHSSLITTTSARVYAQSTDTSEEECLSAAVDTMSAIDAGASD